MDHFMGSNEEFRLLRLAVLAAWLSTINCRGWSHSQAPPRLKPNTKAASVHHSRNQTLWKACCSLEAADPGQLADQVARAPLVWQFLAGFGEKKTLYRSQMAEVIGNLAAVVAPKLMLSPWQTQERAMAETRWLIIGMASRCVFGATGYAGLIKHHHSLAPSA